jgi:hypothetical protein
VRLLNIQFIEEPASQGCGFDPRVGLNPLQNSLFFTFLVDIVFCKLGCANTLVVKVGIGMDMDSFDGVG